MSFQDHFSSVSHDYARFRPNYPDALFEWLANQCTNTQQAWDCATGSGQAAVALARHFEHVHATDASAKQIEKATPHPHISFHVEPAERISLPDHSVDLISVAQALHWFNLDGFYSECRRVLKPEGLLAIWSYNLFRIHADLDDLIDEFYHGTLGQDWPASRRHVENAYAELAFPFEQITTPDFAMQAQWQREHVIGYIGTWSGLKAYRQRTGKDPIHALSQAVYALWPEGETKTVSWPLMLKVGRF